MRRSLALLAPLLWLGLASAGHGADLTEAVPAHQGLTYFDLMKLVVTDLAPDGTGHKVVPFRHIEGKDMKTDLPDAPALQGVDVLPVPGDRSRIILLADIGPAEGFVATTALLGLFALDPSPKLLDLVEVGNDRSTVFGSASPQLLAPGVPLILVDSSHFNSNQNYLTTEMIFLRGNRFALIDSLFTLNERYCAFERDQTPSFATLADPGPYRAVHVTVRATVKLSGEEGCGDGKPPRAGTTMYQATYRWDPSKREFATISKALKRLDAANSKRL